MNGSRFPCFFRGCLERADGADFLHQLVQRWNIEVTLEEGRHDAAVIVGDAEKVPDGLAYVRSMGIYPQVLCL
jgi:hypothetical protein